LIQAFLTGIATPMVVVAMSCSPAVAAPGPGLVLPPAVHAGDTIEIRWDALPESAVEIELVLSLDGGRTFNLHISPELDPRTSRFAWRVPNLPAEGAVVAVRMGDLEGEGIWNTSAPFRIHGDASAPRGRVVLHEGSTWDVLEASAGADARAFGGPRASFEAAAAHASADVPPRSTVCAPAFRTARTGGNVLPRVTCSARPNAAPFPRCDPLRN
jgi:hypothetical protein